MRFTRVLHRKAILCTATATLVTLAGGCQGEKPKTESFRSSDFGETPSKNRPGTNDAIPEGEFISMLNESGESQPAVVVKTSTVESGSLSCPVKPGDKLYIVGKKELKGDEFHYVAQLAKPCDALGEGLISQNDVKLLPFKEKPAVPSTPATPTPPTSGPNSCEEVTQITIPGTSAGDANKVGLIKGGFIGLRGCGEAIKTPKPMPVVDAKPEEQSEKDPKKVDEKDANAKKPDAPVSSIFASAAVKNGGLCMVPGPVFREQGVAKDGSKMAIKIKGEAAKWKITASAKPFDNKWKGGKSAKYNTTTPETLPAVELNAAEFKSEDGTYVIPFDKFLPKTDWMGREIAFEVLPVDANGVAQEDGCIHRFRLASPIVLDLTGAKTLETVHPAKSNVSFDFNADGRAEKTGWILPTSGFLALDLNKNGKIENGRELFGEFTSLQDGVLAENGYAALAQYDASKKGYIGQNDAVYAQLRVWVDANSDGVSQASEVVPLKQLGISRIDTSYSEVEQTSGMLTQGNVPLYESRFFGPAQCGTSGCKSYDVYFGTLSSGISRRK